MRSDVIVVGGGTAGCILAARLSQRPSDTSASSRPVPTTVLSARIAGLWVLDPRTLARTHDWGPGGEDGRSLGGRLGAPSSAVNACMVLTGAPADYDKWGEGWSYEDLRPYLERARTMLLPAPSNTDSPALFQSAFVDAAQAVGLAPLSDPDDPRSPIRNRVVSGERCGRSALEHGPRLPRGRAWAAQPSHQADTLVDHLAGRRRARNRGHLCRRTTRRRRQGDPRGRCVLLSGHPPPERDRA